MYEYVMDRREKIKYVVICTGLDKINREVGEELAEFFAQCGLDPAIHMCSYSGITTVKSGKVTRHKIYQAQVLSTGIVDQMAMLLNHYYCHDESKTPLAHWMECNYFNRMSSRASADFVGAMLRAAGKTAKQVEENGWELTDRQMENLGRTEHLRWCAFHYCMGFSPMSGEDYDARAREYRRQMEQDGRSAIRVSKNMQRRTHACLVSWEELDSLSEKESKLLGRKVDFKAMDKDNVAAIPELLRLSREAEK